MLSHTQSTVSCCTEMDAECDHQATSVGQYMIALCIQTNSCHLLAHTCRVRPTGLIRCLHILQRNSQQIKRIASEPYCIASLADFLSPELHMQKWATRTLHAPCPLSGSLVIRRLGHVMVNVCVKLDVPIFTSYINTKD